MKKEIGVAKQANGYIYTIASVDDPAIIECSKDCFYLNAEFSRCRLKDIMKVSKDVDSFKAVKVVVNFKNTVDVENWHIGASDLTLQDNEGFTYSGAILCDKLLGVRMVGDNYNVKPHSQVNYVQLFPLLPEGASPAALIADAGGTSLRFVIGDMDEAMYQDSPDDYDASSCVTVTSSVDSIILQRIVSINALIHERIHSTTLSSYKLNRKDEQIEALFCSISSIANNILDENVRSTWLDCQVAYNQYRELIKEEASHAEIVANDIKDAEDLLKLSPKEFEFFVAQLLVEMGYDNVHQTPYVNDKGVDIFAEKDGEKVAVQCKRFNATVGSPEIRNFLGSMANARVGKGVFVTTSSFSYEAKMLQLNNKIVLVDKFELSRLIRLRNSRGIQNASFRNEATFDGQLDLSFD